IDPDAMSSGNSADRRGELAVPIPMLVIGSGESKTEGKLEGERWSEVLRREAGREDGHRSGDGKQVARGPGEEDEGTAEEEEREPEDEEERIGVAALAPCGDGQRGNEGGEEYE